jgi:hypothetical protein
VDQRKVLDPELEPHVDEDDFESCLGKVSCHEVESTELQKSSCAHCGAKKWNIMGDDETGLSFKRYCKTKFKKKH